VHHLFEKGDEVLAVTHLRRAGEGLARLWLESAKHPAVAAATVVGLLVGTMSRWRPTATQVGLGTHRSHLIDAEHMGLGWWRFV
jgi:hypothetical protein